MEWQEAKEKQKLHVPGELLFMKSQLFTEVLLLTLTRSPLVLTETPSVHTERWGWGVGWAEVGSLGIGQGLKPNFIPSYRLWKELDVILESYLPTR